MSAIFRKGVRISLQGTLIGLSRETPRVSVNAACITGVHITEKCDVKELDKGASSATVHPVYATFFFERPSPTSVYNIDERPSHESFTVEYKDRQTIDTDIDRIIRVHESISRAFAAILVE